MSSILYTTVIVSTVFILPVFIDLLNSFSKQPEFLIIFEELQMYAFTCVESGSL